VAAELIIVLALAPTRFSLSTKTVLSVAISMFRELVCAEFVLKDG
jgi:hypothetical protein